MSPYFSHNASEIICLKIMQWELSFCALLPFRLVKQWLKCHFWKYPTWSSLNITDLCMSDNSEELTMSHYLNYLPHFTSQLVFFWFLLILSMYFTFTTSNGKFHVKSSFKEDCKRFFKGRGSNLSDLCILVPIQHLLGIQTKGNSFPSILLKIHVGGGSIV